MTFSFSRRQFVQSVSALSFAPFSAFPLSQSEQNNSGYCYFTKDFDNNIYINEKIFPYERKLLIEPNSVVGPHGINTGKDFCLLIGTLTLTDSPYILFVSMQNYEVIYRILSVDHYNSLSESQVQFLGDLSTQTQDSSGNQILLFSDILFLSFQRDNGLQLIFRNKDSQQLKIVTLTDTQKFQMSFVDDFGLDQFSTLTLLPKETMNGKNLCFLWIDEINHQHKFIQLVQNSENQSYSMVQYYSFELNQRLHPHWNYLPTSFQFESESGIKTDRYLFTLNYSENKNHLFLFLRADNSLAAIELNENEEGYSHNVIALSKKTYSLDEYYFYGILWDNHLKQDVLLVKEIAKQRCFILSLEKTNSNNFQFKETPLLLKSECGDSNTTFSNYLSDDGFADRDHDLIPIRSSEIPGISFQIIVDFINDNEKHLYCLNFQENQGNYCLVAGQKKFHKYPSQIKHNLEMPPSNLTLSFHHHSITDTNNDGSSLSSGEEAILLFDIVLGILAYCSFIFGPRLFSWASRNFFNNIWNKQVSGVYLQGSLPQRLASAISRTLSPSKFEKALQLSSEALFAPMKESVDGLESLVRVVINNERVIHSSEEAIIFGQNIIDALQKTIQSDLTSRMNTPMLFNLSTIKNAARIQFDSENNIPVIQGYDQNVFYGLQVLIATDKSDPRLTGTRFLSRLFSVSNLKDTLKRHVFYGLVLQAHEIILNQVSDTLNDSDKGSAFSVSEIFKEKTQFIHHVLSNEIIDIACQHLGYKRQQALDEYKIFFEAQERLRGPF